MPGSHATLKGEKNITALAKRLYQIEGKGRSEALRVAEAALLRANPQLGKAGAFRSGRVVIVPTDTGLKTTDRVTMPEGGIGGAIDDTAFRLKLASQFLNDELASDAKASQASLKQLGNRQFLAKLKKAVPESTQVIPNTRKSIKARVETNTQVKERYAKALKQAQQEIERLKKLAKSNG